MAGQRDLPGRQEMSGYRQLLAKGKDGRSSGASGAGVRAIFDRPSERHYCLKAVITVAQADRILADEAWLLPAEWVPLRDSYGRILHEPLRSDRDLPPYDRATMDGIAVRSAALAAGRRRFAVESEAIAGRPAGSLTSDGGCVRIMTGAVLPRGADAVIRAEDVTLRDGTAEVDADAEAAPWLNVHRTASDGRAGDVVLRAGGRIGEREAAVIASVGASRVSVSRLPGIAILTTGDEVVAVDAAVESHQIRQSNRYAAEAILHGAGLSGGSEHLPDDQALLRARTAELLAGHDVLITTGAVSMGVTDRMPQVLAAAGIDERFHRLNQRPGKPLWFGTGTVDGAPRAAFGLPGNPVSVAVCLRRYVLPFLFRLMAATPPGPEAASLTEEIRFPPPLTYYLPVALDASGGRIDAAPRPTGSSGDFLSLMDSDGFVELPSEPDRFAAGHVAPLYRWGTRAA